MPAHSLPTLLLDAALRGTVIALLLLLGAVLWRDRPQSVVSRAAIALALGLCVQVLGSAPLIEERVPLLWQAPLIAISVGNAVLFWVFVQALFDDEFVLRPLHGAAWLAAAAVSVLNCVLLTRASSLATITMGLQRALPLLFAVLAAMAAIAHWRADLVEERRRLRVFILVAGVAYTVAMLAARLASPQGRLPGLVATVDVAALLIIVSVVAVRLLRVGGSALFAPDESHLRARPGAAVPVDDVPVPSAPDPADDRLADALQRVMEEERAHRSEDLTIASLAARLKVPEYRLRRLINGRLGHRNFNAFVNSYRLDEARAALADPAQRETPVLTIALEAGFQSIGPFNRAFKATTGLTPTEFRREKLADS